ncbi:MAG: hypothetical protein WDN31_17240 [Hyphomicrobium sp.]
MLLPHGCDSRLPPGSLLLLNRRPNVLIRADVEAMLARASSRSGFTMTFNVLPLPVRSADAAFAPAPVNLGDLPNGGSKTSIRAWIRRS